MARPSGREIRSEVLDEARRAIQSSGVNGFSYSDLASRIGVKAPSIHHHFRKKEDLVAATTKAYREEFRTLVDAIDEPTAIGRLRAYGKLFLSPARENLMCLCGSVAVEWDGVDSATQREVDAFVNGEVQWVTTQVEAAVAAGDVRSTLDPGAMALTYIATLEGALVLARTSAAREVVLDAANGFVDLIAT